MGDETEKTLAPADEDRLLDLLVEWEERQQQGTTLQAEQLCPDDPALQEKLRRRIGRRLRVRAALEPAASVETAESLPEVEGYEVLGVLGHGGMGVVYKAKQRRLGRLVALKMILGAGAGPAERARFRVEAEAVAALQHANVVQVYQTGEANGQPFLALELVGGGSLADLLRGGPLPARRAAELVERIAGAVQHAHERGIIHRDLKPANVLLASDGTPKVTDFGLAKLLGDSSQTRTGDVMGTPSYMAPEQATGSKQVGPLADVYALGAILYECLTGRPPFLGASVLETLRQINEHDPVPPSRLNPAVPRDLEVICLKCLEKDQHHRYGSAKELADDLRRYLDGEPVSVRSATVFDQVERALRRSNLDPRFREWGRMLLILAPMPPLILLPLVLLFGDRPHYPYLILAATALVVLSIRVFVFWAGRSVMRVVPAAQRRQIHVVWFSHAVVFVVLLFVVWLTTPPDQPDRLLLAYSYWLLTAALVLFSMAPHAGFLHVLGGVAVLLSVVAALAPTWSPMIVGLFASLIMTSMGLFLRRLRPNG
jgi:serine/threonine-protein kinase